MSENVNITQLPLTTSMQNTDTMVVISDGKAKRFSYGNLAGNLNDWSSITNKVFDTYDKEYFNTYLSEVNNISQNVLTFKPDSLNTHINGLIQEGVWNVLTSGNGIAIGKDTVASGDYSFAEGQNTTASGTGSHAEGAGSTASGTYSHAEGGGAYALGVQAHAEGSGTAATGLSSHSEGIGSATAIKDSDGNITGVNGTGIASGKGSHVEGIQCNASGDGSHSGGENSVAAGVSSFAHGIGTVVNHDGEVAFGSYNQSNEKTVFSVGNGTAEARSNIFEVDSDGNVYAKKFIGETTSGTMISDWAANTDYEVGNLIINGNILYKCITSHTSGEIFDETESVNWTVLSGEQGVKGNDGISPIATVESTDTGCIVTVIDASGTTTANLTNGTTPHIDETTKHWKIGDVDTGVVAEAVTDINYVFSTDEQVAGVWIDGRTIYKKTIIFDAPKQSTSMMSVTTYNHNIENIDIIWFSGESFWVTNGVQKVMAFQIGIGDDLTPNYQHAFNCSVNATNIKILSGPALGDINVYATVMYIKNNS